MKQNGLEKPSFGRLPYIYRLTPAERVCKAFALRILAADTNTPALCVSMAPALSALGTGMTMVHELARTVTARIARTHPTIHVKSQLDLHYLGHNKTPC
jgi:hypothetical protein